MRESKNRHRWHRSLPACDVEDGCECNLFKLDWRARPVREPAPLKCCSADPRTSGRHAVRPAAASPAKLGVPLAGHLSRHLAKAGLARKGQGKVCQTPNSSRRFYDLRFSRKQMTMTINTPAVLDSPELRILPKSPGTRRGRRRKRLFIRVRAFEVRYFPVHVRRIEHAGSDTLKCRVQSAE